MEQWRENEQIHLKSSPALIFSQERMFDAEANSYSTSNLWWVRGAIHPSIFLLFEANSIIVVKVPANCTDRLQPMNLSVNKAVKAFLRKKNSDLVFTGGRKLYRTTLSRTFIPVNLRMSILKLLGVEQLVSAYQYLQSNGSLARNRFQAAGITGILEL